MSRFTLVKKEKTSSHTIYKIFGLIIKFKRSHKKIPSNSSVHNVKFLSPNIKIRKNVEICSNFKDSIIIDAGTSICCGTQISNHECNATIKIGKNCQIGDYNKFYGQGGIEIGNNVITASNVCILSSNHNWEDIATPIMKQPSTYKKVTIEDDCWLGYNVIILAGVHIGKHVTIGAGSIVTKDMPNYSVCAGNPCRVIKLYNFKTQKWEKP